MEWKSFLGAYKEMSDEVQRGLVLSLESVGPGDEVSEAVSSIENAEIRLRLIEKAMELEAVFSVRDLTIMDTLIPCAEIEKIVRYGKIKFGFADDVVRAINKLSDENIRRALYERAYIEDVSFSDEDIERMGFDKIDSAHDEPEVSSDGNASKAIGCGCLGFLLGFGVISKLTKKHSKGKGER